MESNGGHVMKIPTTAVMDENSVSHHNGGQVGSQTGLAVSNKSNEETSHNVQYTIPGILHFIQHEWARFEMERSQWEVDRAEFEARIAFLQGERKGQENLKNDLVRRIKMLEYALKQERAKFHKLKYGVDLQQGDVKPPPDEVISNPPDTLVEESHDWRQGKQLIKQYLAEVGYAEDVLNVRSGRINALLPATDITSSSPSDDCVKDRHPSRERESSCHARNADYPPDKFFRRAGVPLAGFDFLGNRRLDLDDYDSSKETSYAGKQTSEEVDHEAEEVLNELNLISETETDVGGQGDDFQSIVGPGVAAGAELGELAALAHGPPAPANDVTADAFRKTWNPKYTLRSHFDAVRALAFHPTDASLVTASDDRTLKLWSLQRTLPPKKSAAFDVEPLHTFRAHKAPVLCLALTHTDLYSGSLDGKIRVWTLPSSTAEPYDAFEPSALGPELDAHTDAVWSLTAGPARLLSASADGTVKLWAPRAARPLLTTLKAEQGVGAPSAADWAGENRAAVSYTSGHTHVIDLETGRPVLKLACESRATRVRSHPTLAITITAHEDRHVRFWDNGTGRLAHAMVAHLDAVTGLAVDPEGLFLLTGSHDCSVRLWNLDARVCVQEINAHRKKFDESILDVAFHPSRPYIASAGADGLAKVFV